MGREALAISISPLQNLAKPLLVPDSPTAIFTEPFLFVESFHHYSGEGYRVLEPSILIVVSADAMLTALTKPINIPSTAKDYIRQAKLICF
jgi:hypothetical protein